MKQIIAVELLKLRFYELIDIDKNELLISKKKVLKNYESFYWARKSGQGSRIPNMMYRFHPRNSDPHSVDDHKF